MLFSEICNFGAFLIGNSFPPTRWRKTMSFLICKGFGLCIRTCLKKIKITCLSSITPWVAQGNKKWYII